MKALPPVRLFVSYSHLDKEWFAKVRPLLFFDGHVEFVHVWHDHELKAGERWEREIKAELKRMDIFLCLLSYHFRASDFIREVELKEALKREQQGKTLIVPLMICDMVEEDIEDLKPFNPLPEWGRSWRDYEKNGGHTIDAHKPIRAGLRQAVEKVRAKKLVVR